MAVTVDDVLGALAKRPRLRFAVAYALHHLKLAGPWDGPHTVPWPGKSDEPESGREWTRQGTSGVVVAAIIQHDEIPEEMSGRMPYEWAAVPSEDEFEMPYVYDGKEPELDEAMAAADKELVNDGWLLT